MLCMCEQGAVVSVFRRDSKLISLYYRFRDLGLGLGVALGRAGCCPNRLSSRTVICW